MWEIKDHPGEVIATYGAKRLKRYAAGIYGEVTIIDGKEHKSASTFRFGTAEGFWLEQLHNTVVSQKKYSAHLCDVLKLTKALIPVVKKKLTIGQRIERWVFRKLGVKDYK